MKFSRIQLLSSCALFSAMPLIAKAQEILPPKVYSTTPGGINVADATFAYSVSDLVIGPLNLERYHLTGVKKPNNPLIGTNMSHSFDIYVASNLRSNTGPPWNLPNRYRPVVHIGSSASGVYAQPTNNLASITAWNLDAQRSGILSWSGSASWSGGHYVYTDRSGAIYTFSETVSAAGVSFNSQRVSQIVFPGGRIQTFSYNASQQLKLVSDSSGYAIVFDYNAASDVSAACGFNLSETYVTASSTCTSAALKVTYSYDSSGNLTSVTGVDSQTTAYPGNTSYGIPCVQPPGYSGCKVSMSYQNVTSFPVTTQTMADGSVWTVQGSRPEIINDPESPEDPTDGGNSGSVTDPAGKVTSFTFTKSTPYAVTDPNGRTSAYRFEGGIEQDYMGTPYSEGTLLMSAAMPEGNTYQAEYNGPFRSVTRETMVAKSGSGLANLVKDYGYGSCFTTGTYQNCAKPIWIKDPKGNQTDYTYASHGGVLSEMQPAPSSGAARPLKLVTYTQKYAYVRNSGGALSPALAPVWLPDTETLCQTYAGSSTATCDTAAPITVTTYEYGANGTADNLLLRGKVVSSGGVSLRTCYGYDWRGNKIWETSPRAGLSVCQ